MSRLALSLTIFATLLFSCRGHQPPPVEIPPPPPALPQWVVLSKGAVDLSDQVEERSISTKDQLGADRCTFAALQIGKDAWLHSSRVADSLTIGGDARFYGSRISGAVNVQGGIHSHHSNFSAAVECGADITAVDTVFDDLLQAKAEIIDLTNVKAKSIFVKATGPYYDKQLVYIKGNTVIEGDVIFESERGRVIYDINSQVLGSIRGGHAIPSYECDRIILESNWK